MSSPIQWHCFPALAILLVAIFGPGCSKASQEEGVVREVTRRIASAYGRDGGLIAEHLSSANLGYYDEALKLAISGSRHELDGIPHSQRQIVLRTRLEFSREQMRRMSGRDLFVHGHSRTGSEKELGQEAGAQVEAVRVVGNRATATVRRAGRMDPSTLHFVKEGGIWKVEFLRGLAEADAKQQAELEKLGLRPTEYTRRRLEASRRMKIDDRIWDVQP